MKETPRILIVDDEERFRNTLTKLLKSRGFLTQSVANGEETKAELLRNAYDVVLLDVKMPGISGIDVLKWMKKEGVAAEVIILSGHASVDTAMEIIDHGAYDYLLKPSDIEEILLKISLAYERKLEKEKANLGR
jgi:DNA-binding NtrC family response regulator